MLGVGTLSPAYGNSEFQILLSPAIISNILKLLFNFADSADNIEAAKLVRKIIINHEKISEQPDSHHKNVFKIMATRNFPSLI